MIPQESPNVGRDSGPRRLAIAVGHESGYQADFSEQMIQRRRGSMRLSEEDREGNELMGADVGCAFINAQCFGELWWQWCDDVESHVLGVGREML